MTEIEQFVNAGLGAQRAVNRLTKRPQITPAQVIRYSKHSRLKAARRLKAGLNVHFEVGALAADLAGVINGNNKSLGAAIARFKNV